MSTFDNFLRLNFIGINKRILVVCRNSLISEELKEFFEERRCRINKGELDQWLVLNDTNDSASIPLVLELLMEIVLMETLATK